MQIMYATYGLPGCGKNYRGKQWRDWQEATRLNRQMFDRDSIRQLLGIPPRGDKHQEDEVTEMLWRKVRNSAARGRDLWIACTNLGQTDLPRLSGWANTLGMRFVVVDFSRVPLRTCLQRNQARAADGGRLVPEHVIRSMGEHMICPCPWEGEVIPWDQVPMDGWLPVGSSMSVGCDSP